MGEFFEKNQFRDTFFRTHPDAKIWISAKITKIVLCTVVYS